ADGPLRGRARGGRPGDRAGDRGRAATHALPGDPRRAPAHGTPALAPRSRLRRLPAHAVPATRGIANVRSALFPGIRAHGLWASETSWVGWPRRLRASAWSAACLSAGVTDERCHDSRSRLARRLPSPVWGRTAAMSVLASASRDAHEPEGHFAGILLPVQAVSRRDAGTHSVRLLMIAIVRDAIDCFQKYLLDSSPRGRRLYREAETWLMTKQESSPLAFEEICDGIGLDPDYVRHHLSAWRAREIARP